MPVPRAASAKNRTIRLHMSRRMKTTSKRITGKKRTSKKWKPTEITRISTAADAIDEDSPTWEDEPSEDELEEIEEELSKIIIVEDLVDDPVRMYLREIGRVDLLEPYQEVWLCIIREAVAQLNVCLSDSCYGG